MKEHVSKSFKKDESLKNIIILQQGIDDKQYTDTDEFVVSATLPTGNLTYLFYWKSLILRLNPQNECTLSVLLKFI